MRILLVVVVCLVGGFWSFDVECSAQVVDPVKPVVEHGKVPLVEEFLIAGKLKEGEAALLEKLKANPEDDEIRFGLGVLQFLRAIENLSQSFVKYGLKPKRFVFENLPFFRIYRVINSIDDDKAEKPPQVQIDYEAYRGLFLKLEADLKKAEKTLAEVKDDKVKLRLHFGKIRMDFNGDGKVSSRESLANIYSIFNRNFDPSFRESRLPEDMQKALDELAISFDRADAYWLQGYCHLLMAMNEIMLALDWEEEFKRTGHMLFPDKKESFEFLKIENDENNLFNNENIIDVIAFIHLLGPPVKEPERMKELLKHLNEVTRLSRLTFAALKAETDDVEEWLPNPRQNGVIPGTRITVEMVEQWHNFLDETDLILAGKKLVPHWRFKNDYGINFKKLIEDMKRFDVVLMTQGTDLEYCVEKGVLTDPAIWNQLQRTFNGNFFGFAMWFN